MSTKINAARMCLEKNIDVVIANANNFKIIRQIMKGDEVGTYFTR